MNSSIQTTHNSSAYLTQIYLDAVTNYIMMLRATNLANQTEQQAVDNLRNLNVSNGAYITANDIPREVGNKFAVDSANAQLSKIQAEQITESTKQVIGQQEEEAKKNFIGRKVIVKKIDPKADVFDAVLLDKKSGQYRVSKYNTKSTKGKIVDINLAKNLLVIKPTYTARLINPNRVFINTYVIDTNNMKMAVEIN
jgi:hypothetical protein